MFALQPLGQAEHSRKDARLLPPSPVQRSKQLVGSRRLRLAVVVSHQAGHHVLGPTAKSRDFRVAHKIFTVAVVRLSVHEMPGIVKRGGSLQNGAQFNLHPMVGPKLVKQAHGQAPNLFAVL